MSNDEGRLNRVSTSTRLHDPRKTLIKPHKVFATCLLGHQFTNYCFTCKVNEKIPHTSNRRHSCHVCETEEAQLLKRMKTRFLTITCNCLPPTGLQSRHSYGMKKTLARPPHTAALATRLLETITWVVQVPLLGPLKRIVKVSQQQTPPRTFSPLQQEDAIWVPSSHRCLEGGFVGNPVSMGFTSDVLTPLLTGNLKVKQLS